MSTENKDQQLEQQIDPTKEAPTEISSPPQPQTRITDEVKKLLNSLIKKNLDKRIKRLENRNEDQNKNVKIMRSFFHLNLCTLNVNLRRCFILYWI